MSAAETRSNGRAAAGTITWLLARGMAIRFDGGEGWLMVVGRGGEASSGLEVVEELSGVTLHRRERLGH